MPGLKVIARGLRRVRSTGSAPTKTTISEKSDITAQPVSPPPPPAYTPSPSATPGLSASVPDPEAEARRAKLEARLRIAAEGLAADIADREDAKKAADEHAIAACDEKIVHDTHHLADATDPIDHKAAVQLHSDANTYQKADRHGKNKIAHKLCKFVTKVVVHKLVGIMLVAALTSVATTSIAVDVTDDSGNVIGEAEIRPDDDGTFDAYLDTDGDGVIDTHVDNVQQTADGNFEADPCDAEDTGFFEGLLDMISNVF
ncbi:hypothetical protein IAT40_000825 [Kwoniella sp. CBS 6097]